MGLAHNRAEATIDFLFPGRPIRLQPVKGRASQAQQGMTSSRAAFLWFAGLSAVYHCSERKATAVRIGSDTRLLSAGPDSTVQLLRAELMGPFSLVRWGGGFFSRSGS